MSVARDGPLLIEEATSHIAGDTNQTSPTNKKSWIASICAQQEMVFWCLYWFTANLTITFYNKHVLSSLNVSPLINTFVHMTCTFIGCIIVQKFKFPSFEKNIQVEDI